MLKVNGYNTPKAASYYNAKTNNHTQSNNNPSFGRLNAKKALGWAADQFNIESNGSLTRAMFIAVAGLFMLGGRIIKSRDKDETREVITRDVPAVLISVLLAPFLNKAMAYGVTKASGVPIIKMAEKGTKHRLFNSSFSSQKQVIDWYSQLGENALVNFTKTIDENEGNIVKVFNKLNLSKNLKNITEATDNKSIRAAIKTAKEQNTEAFQVLENALKSLSKDNKLVNFAKNSQAVVKLIGIAVTAGILGYFLPHLNIVITRNKYKKKLDNGQINQAEFEKRMMRTSPVFRVSSGVLSFHKTSAKKTFKNLLEMVEQPISK